MEAKSSANSEDWEDLLGFEERGKDEKWLSRPRGKWMDFMVLQLQQCSQGTECQI